jgi:hypothetical protein
MHMKQFSLRFEAIHTSMVSVDVEARLHVVLPMNIAASVQYDVHSIGLTAWAFVCEIRLTRIFPSRLKTSHVESGILPPI